MLTSKDKFIKINQLTEKTTPANDDLFIIEDSAASNARKKVKYSNIGGGGGTSDHTALSNLGWTSSDHTGTADTVPVFDGSGNADEIAVENGQTWTPTVYIGGAEYDKTYYGRSGSYGVFGNSVFFGFRVLIAGSIMSSYNKTGDTTNGSKIITNVSDFTNLVVNMAVSGTGIATNSVISSMDVGAGTITLDRNATATNTGVTLTFSYKGRIEVDGLPYTSSSSGASIGILSTGFSFNGMIQGRVQPSATLCDFFDINSTTGASTLLSDTNLYAVVVELNGSGVYQKA